MERADREHHGRWSYRHGWKDDLGDGEGGGRNINSVEYRLERRNHILEDYITNTSTYSTNPSTWTNYLEISGLDPSHTYNLYVFCGVAGGRFGLLSNPTATQDATMVPGGGDRAYNPGPDSAPWTQGQNYVLFTNVSPTAFAIGGDTGTRPSWSAWETTMERPESKSQTFPVLRCSM